MKHEIIRRDSNGRQREEHFYRSHLLLPRKKVVYRTMVIYCQMANQQQKNRNIPVIPPQNKENRQIHCNTMVIYLLDKTSAMSLF